MKEISYKEVYIVSGAGWASMIMPIVGGFIIGGPIGAGIAVSGVIASKGIDNLQHLHQHGTVPTLGQMVSG